MNPQQNNIVCEVKNCQAKEEGAEAIRHMCDYCTQNKAAKDPTRDYSAAIREGGY